MITDEIARNGDLVRTVARVHAGRLRNLSMSAALIGSSGDFVGISGLNKVVNRISPGMRRFSQARDYRLKERRFSRIRDSRQTGLTRPRPFTPYASPTFYAVHVPGQEY